ncbi:MAG TPA: FAD-dependent oxidoreductase [Aldersonia sp.]
MSATDQSTGEQTRCDVCIVGAGITGMNALFVASRYLDRSHKVVLVDRRPRVGGMWVDTYPYVRLHQPYRLFTAGNIKWTIGREPGYLATKSEVLDHFQHCLEVLGERVQVETRFGWDYEGHEERDDGVVITCRDGEHTLTISADKLITAYGAGVTPNPPLTLSSTRITSVSPDSWDMRGVDMRESEAPVWIIGGGKTAMDTAHVLITEYPGREVNLVVGSGTYFSSRDKFLPTGGKRWWGGARPNSVFLEMTARFDGTNQREVRDWFRRTYSTSLVPNPRNYFFGLLSEAENDVVRSGAKRIVLGHCEDVADNDGQPVLRLCNGGAIPVAPGSWVINCTGYLNGDNAVYEPVLSSGGRVMSVNLCAMVYIPSSSAAYFLTHLFLLGLLSGTPLYDLDYVGLRAKSKDVLPLALASLVVYNLGVIAEAVPAKVFQEWGLDLDRWYPMHRRMYGQVKGRISTRKGREHLRRTLDTVRERFDVRCGPIQVG